MKFSTSACLSAFSGFSFMVFGVVISKINLLKNCDAPCLNNICEGASDAILKQLNEVHADCQENFSIGEGTGVTLALLTGAAGLGLGYKAFQAYKQERLPPHECTDIELTGFPLSDDPVTTHAPR